MLLIHQAPVPLRKGSPKIQVTNPKVRAQPSPAHSFLMAKAVPSVYEQVTDRHAPGGRI